MTTPRTATSSDDYSGAGATGFDVRTLTADDLGIGSDAALAQHASNEPDEPPMDAGDPLLLEVQRLLQFYGGIVFSGPPGTSKSWTAARLSYALVEGDDTRRRFVQFHPSYQYEDFIQGYSPKADGTGFELRDHHFVLMCRDASNDLDHPYVMVIDELSRGDPGRIFGEALTYVETSKRGMPFLLASGAELIVPPNLFILATMNPNDRGVDEVDAAFERRFARMAMEPDANILESMLDANGMPPPLSRALVGFFRSVNRQARTNPAMAIGHTYFAGARTADDLRTIWRYQLQFILEKAFRLDPASFRDIEKRWTDTVNTSTTIDPTVDGQPVDSPPTEDSDGEQSQ